MPTSVTTPTREKDGLLANTGQYDRANYDSVVTAVDNSPRSENQENDDKISQQESMEMEGGASGVQSDVSTTSGVQSDESTIIGVQSDESTTTGAQSVVGGVQSDETLSVGVQSDDDVWLKFNDVSVIEVSWADVQKESYGGSHNTSAYCLIYVNKELHHQFTRRGVSSYASVRMRKRSIR